MFGESIVCFLSLPQRGSNKGLKTSYCGLCKFIQQLNQWLFVV